MPSRRLTILAGVSVVAFAFFFCAHFVETDLRRFTITPTATGYIDGETAIGIGGGCCYVDSLRSRTPSRRAIKRESSTEFVYHIRWPRAKESLWGFDAEYTHDPHIRVIVMAFPLWCLMFPCTIA